MHSLTFRVRVMLR